MKTRIKPFVSAIFAVVLAGTFLTESATAASWRNRGSGSAQSSAAYKGDVMIDAASSRNPNYLRFQVTWTTGSGKAMPHSFNWSLACRSDSYSGPSTYRSGSFQKRLSPGQTLSRSFDVRKFNYCVLDVWAGPRYTGPDVAGKTQVKIQQR